MNRELWIRSDFPRELVYPLLYSKYYTVFSTFQECVSQRNILLLNCGSCGKINSQFFHIKGHWAKLFTTPYPVLVWLFWVQKLDSVLVSLTPTCSFCRLLDSLAILWFPWGQILCLKSASSGCPSQCMAFHKCLINACGIKEWTYWKSLNL